MTDTIEIARDLREGLAELRCRIEGRVSSPEDAGWDADRAAWALAVDQRPALVVRAAGVEDVVTAVRFAIAHGLRVAPQGTGHNAAPLGHLGDTVLLRTDLMRGVAIDPERMIARVNAGVLWQQVVDAAAAHGLAALAGSSADVGVVGYTLGGGVSWLARSHGLAANSVTAIELVTADGELRRVDERCDSDLFWAVRGGGGAFGVVTALEFRLYPLTSVYAGALSWPIDRAAEVMHAWREWTVGLPASVMSTVRVMTFPPILDVPEPLRGGAFVIVEAVLQDPRVAAEALLAELRRMGPAMDTFAPTPMPALSALHMDPPGPVPGIGDGALIRDLDAAAIEAFLSVAASARGRSIATAEFRVLGAALAPGQEDGGAVSGLDGSYLLFAGGLALTPESGTAVRAELDDLLQVMAPWRAASDYLNFAETTAEPERLYGAALPRLRAIKQRVDPHDVIRSNHPLGAGR
ncbi:MAG: FAD-binding oxidoreductase [Micropruina sp.]